MATTRAASLFIPMVIQVLGVGGTVSKREPRVPSCAPGPVALAYGLDQPLVPGTAPRAPAAATGAAAAIWLAILRVATATINVRTVAGKQGVASRASINVPQD
eukprot:3046730-Prymnesium_polylepis.3